jgi:hypothetical protein
VECLCGGGRGGGGERGIENYVSSIPHLFEVQSAIEFRINPAVLIRVANKSNRQIFVPDSAIKQ